MARRVLTCAVGCALSCCAVPAVTAQVNLNVNTIVDAADYNLPDGVCDCDSVTPGPQCSLRAALQNANQMGGWVIINLGATTYVLSLGGADDLGAVGDLDVFAVALTRLEILGAAGTVINGSGLIAGGAPDRIFHILPSVAGTCDIIVSNLTVQNGAGVQFGAGLNQQSGRVRLSNVTFIDCTATSAGGGVHTTTAQAFIHTGGGYNNCDAAVFGGGAFLGSTAAATVALNGLNILNCDAPTMGGGVRVAQNAVASISNCSIGSANDSASGGGVSNRGSLTMIDTSVAANFSSSVGGGVANDLGATLIMNRCTLVQNQATIGGGLSNAGGATLTDCTIRLNNADTAGGVSNTAAAAAPLRLQNSTIAFNFATGAVGGGGYRGFGAMEMINCTLSGNAAQSARGGGIYFDGGLQTVDINASTIAFNFANVTGGGLYTDNALGVTAIRFRSCILANNTSPGVNNNFAGAFLPTSMGFNLDSGNTCQFAGPGDLSFVPAMLGPLQNNGGPTETRALLAGSPAINAGSCTTIAGGTIGQDQRGYLRAAPCDMGAYESGGVPPPANDLCANAAAVTTGSLSFNNAGANTDGPPAACGFTGLPGQDSDVWFNFTAPCSGTATISISPVAPGPTGRLLAVYASCPVIGVGPSPIACNSSTGGPPASAAIAVIAGQSYRIRSGMPAGNQGASILGISIACACPGDIDGNTVVNVNDLLSVVSTWGPCPAPCPPRCTADIAPLGPPQGDCQVNVNDLLAVITTWGPCP